MVRYLLPSIAGLYFLDDTEYGITPGWRRNCFNAITWSVLVLAVLVSMMLAPTVSVINLVIGDTAGEKLVESLTGFLQSGSIPDGDTFYQGHI